MYNVILVMILRKTTRAHALLVLVFAVYFVIFAVYIKSAGPGPSREQSPAVKIWVDSDPTILHVVKIAPVSVFFLFLLLMSTRPPSAGPIGIEEDCSQETPKQLFSNAPAWLRPPPLR